MKKSTVTRFKIHNAWSLTAILVLWSIVLPSILEAGSFPDVKLRDKSGQSMVQAAIHSKGRQWRVHVKTSILPTQQYELIIAKGRQCFSTDTPESTREVVAKGPLFPAGIGSDTVVDITMPIKSSGIDINRLIDDRELILWMVPNTLGVPVCGKISPWYSPWRDSRR